MQREADEGTVDPRCGRGSTTANVLEFVRDRQAAGTIIDMVTASQRKTYSLSNRFVGRRTQIKASKGAADPLLYARVADCKSQTILEPSPDHQYRCCTEMMLDPQDPCFASGGTSIFW
jgi:hypothetical protein